MIVSPSFGAPSVRMLRARLLRGASGGALAMMVSASPAQAQLANLAGALGHAVTVAVLTQVGSAATQSASPTMAQIAARHADYKARVAGQTDMVANASAAARAAAAAAVASVKGTVIAASQVSQRTDASGNPVYYSVVNNRIMELSAQVGADNSKTFVVLGEVNGLSAVGLDPAVKAPTASVDDATGLKVWQGASLPVQAAGTNNVIVNQTDSRALLSWNSFNVGRDTTLTFNQQGHNDWVAVNRVVGAINPATGLIDPSLNPSPTQILGQIKADGTVYVLDRSGVLFGASSQVNLHSLVASSLELGRTIAKNTATGSGQPAFVQASLATLNNSFLQNGILPGSHVGLLGSIAGETHGAVTVQLGAQISSSGGFVILAAPQVTMAGEINPAKSPTGAALTPSLGSQVSLVAGNYVDASVSTGSADSLDPNVRGLLLSAVGGGTVDVSGSISAPQGYISLVTDPKGTVNLSGVLSSTTSVSRNGKISLIGGTINLLQSDPLVDLNGNVLRDSAGNDFQPIATLSITPDLGGATIPQAADSVAGFKTSQIDIGNYDTELSGLGLAMLDTRDASPQGGLFTPTLLPTLVSIGANSTIYAPGADVNVGGHAGAARFVASLFPTIGPTGVTVGAGAVIDVSGLDAVEIAASRNQIEISPTKKNELRDTPTYRDPAAPGGFSLNGATLYVDPRLSGVRDDGVAWVGSPLIEAGSLAGQIGVTVQELLTKGGNVTLATMEMDQSTLALPVKPAVTIAPTATIDFSGGWVNYQAGQIRSSKLITADGRVVDIASADPNDIFIGIANGFVETLPQLGAPRVFANSLITPTHFEAGYSEGRDAGSFTISAPTASFNAQLFGEAVAGARQILDAKAPTGISKIANDPRKMQAAYGQLPSAGLLAFSTKLGGSVFVGGQATTLDDGSAGIQVGSNRFAATDGLVHILASTIENAGLSALTLDTSGSVTFAAGSTLDLQPGGALGVHAGRAIAFNGTISAPAGSIAAITYGNRYGDLFDSGDDFAQDLVLTGATPAWFALADGGNASGVRNTDGWFDVSVNPGALLSTRGLWTNDLIVTDGQYKGGAFTSGGSISLAVAPHVLAFTDATRTRAVDLSGSIGLSAGSLLDVSGGGFLSRTGELSLSGKGGNVSLTDQTVYFQLQQADSAAQGREEGINLFNSDLTTFQITAVPGVGFDSAVVPDELRNGVSIAAGTIRGFGFQGGGTFQLTTPDLAFGSSGGTGTAIPLSFLADTGFANLSLTAWNTTFIDNVFANGRTGKTALLSTETVRIGAGETLDLTQSVLPSLLNTLQITTLRSQASGADISRLADFAPTSQLGDFYNRAATLSLGGLTELDLDGGTITGAAGASITVPKLYQAGTIAITGGTITQREYLPASYVLPNAGIGVSLLEDGTTLDPTAALKAVFGQADENGLYDENAVSAFDKVTINRTLIAKAGADHQIYYLGRLGQEDGIVFAAGSSTDLSGAVILDTLAPIRGGVRIRQGKLVDGGTIQALGRFEGAANLFSPNIPSSDGIGFTTRGQGSLFVPQSGRTGRLVNAEAGAVIDIAGASGTFDLQGPGATSAATAVWTNGGRLAGLGGGSVSLAAIDAGGGAAGAQGGTFDWFNPVLRQNADAALPTGTIADSSSIFADQLAASGFDSLVARGTLSTLGDVSLSLGRSFLLQSPDSLGVTQANSFNYYATRITSTGDLSITAPHILLSSIRQFVPNLPDRAVGFAGGHTLTLRAEAASGSGASFDIMGAVGIDAGFAQADLSSQGDIRLIGVQPIINTLDPTAALQVPSLSGGLVAAGRLSLQAREIYATTGTGNLLRDTSIPTDGISTYAGPFLIASFARDTTNTPTVAFRTEPGTTPSTPYSAGSYIQVIAENILQDGALFAPVGRIDLGARTDTNIVGFLNNGDAIRTSSLVLANGSITSVSGQGMTIPYGTTTDLTDHYFLPTLTAPLSSLPAAQLSFSAADIATEAGATVDASGGGTLYGYEFVSGTGGSRDVLSRFNVDPFSGNNGYQYPDGRQVYAILPASNAQLAALYDPVYSSDYAGLYGSEVGKTVTLDAVPESAPGKGDGLAAGQYLLLPAKYALLPGAMRVVENVGAATPLANSGTRDIDGSIRVGGVLGVAGTGLVEPLRRSFTVQSQASFTRYSLIQTTDPAAFLETNAGQSGSILPPLPNDAARIVIDPGTGLTIGSQFDTTARASASGKAGRGSKVDILGDIINIVTNDDNKASRGVSITTGTLVNLNAASLMIGGSRAEQSDGSTAVAVSASEIHVRNTNADDGIRNETIALSGSELLFAVNGVSSILDIADNASLTATGLLADTRDGVYDLTTTGADGKSVGTYGAFLRLANGPERLADRTGATEPDIGKDKSSFTVGAASFTGQSLTLDTSRNIEMEAANLAVDKIALGSTSISFSTREGGVAGFVISPDLEAKLATIGQVTLISPTAVGFTPGAVVDGSDAHNFRKLVIDAPGIRLIRPVRGKKNTDSIAVTIDATDVVLRNDFGDLGGCTRLGVLICGATGNSLAINASGTLTLGSGVFHSYGFETTAGKTGTVSIGAAGGTFYSGKGSLELANAAFNMVTPFIADLGTGAVPKAGSVQADYAINTTNIVKISSPGDVTIAAPTTPLAPGARFAIGSLDDAAGSSAFAVGNDSLTITNTLIRATAGTIDLNAQENLTLAGTATLSATSYQQQFGPTGDPDTVTVSANAGAISLTARTGDLSLAAGTRIAIGGATGGTGDLNLFASEGKVTLGGTIDAAAPGGGGNFALDAGTGASTGTGAFAFTDFVTRYGTMFNGRVAIRTGLGDLKLDAGKVYKLTSLSLTADGGFAEIDGTVDTSGATGGNIALFGNKGVTLGAGSLLDTHATGYGLLDTRQAQAGDIMLGVVGDGALAIGAGARLDLSATNSVARLVPKAQVDPATQNQITSYTLVEGDLGGALTLRAPVVTTAGTDAVNVSFAGTVAGARDISLIGYKRYNLSEIDANPLFNGVSIDAGVATLNPGAVANNGKVNFLTDELTPGAIPYFIQNFDISATNARLGTLTSLAAFHERPGVELDFVGDIVLKSSWNLGAGSITDYAAASAAGDLVSSKLSLIEKKPVYEVVAGKEADLFQNYVHMLYRTGTGVNTGGEAAAFTFRAGRNLDIKGSITDGFFNFGDQTDGTYLTYQLGGGTLLAQPTFEYGCRGPDGCGNLQDFVPTDGSTVPAAPKAKQSITIAFNKPKSTLIEVAAPYSDTANAASAYSQGLKPGEIGDPFGAAQIFPLLADGSAAASSDIQLVGGGGSLRSANPLHVDRGSDGSVIVEGSTSYRLEAKQPPKVVYNGEALIRVVGDNDSFTSDEISTDVLAGQLGLAVDGASDDAATRITFGKQSNVANEALAQAARDFVAAHPGQARLLGRASAPTGIATTLALAVEFMATTRAIDQVGDKLQGLTGAKIGGRFTGKRDITVRTLVRTGTGAIDIAAANDVDLTNGDPVMRNANGGKTGSNRNPAMQQGGAAVYTVGHVVKPTRVTAIVAGTTQELTVDPTAYLPSDNLFKTSWRPDASGSLQANPVFASGGGSVSIEAGDDVLGRRDVWAEGLKGQDVNMVGNASQPWRVGKIGGDQNDLLASTYIRINPQQFRSGVGALGGGDVSIRAGGDVSELTVALDTTLASAKVGDDSFAAMNYGGGSLDVYVGGSVLGGRFDIASGTATISAREDIGSSGLLAQLPNYGQPSVDTKKGTVTLRENLPEIRLTDTQVTLSAGGSIALSRIGALGVDNNPNSQGMYTGTSAVTARAFGDFTLTGGALNVSTSSTRVLPATLDVTSFGGDIDLSSIDNFLYPSATGQLSLLAAGTLKASAIDLDDGDPSYLPGLYSAQHTDPNNDKILLTGRDFAMPGILANTTDGRRRLYHNPAITHAGDDMPARIVVGGSLENLSLYSAKQMRVSAGLDILNMIFVGQNLTADDSTRIRAGRDITASTSVTNGLSLGTTNGRKVVQGNYFAVGGPGSLFLEAGRNLGPFLNSATIASQILQAQPGSPRVDAATPGVGSDSYAGGVLAVGNDFNPWLAPKSADIYTFFGVAGGMDFDALRETYVNPANVAKLPGDLFEQTSDAFGNQSPDRTKPIYAPILVAWMQANAAGALTARFGSTDVSADQAYTAFAALPELVQRRFLLDKVYFNELAITGNPAGPSYLQYGRGYLAAETLLPPSRGYSQSLARDDAGAYIVDPATGFPYRLLKPELAAQDPQTQDFGAPVIRHTGSLDLRLAPIETTRDSSITILGPGGDAVLGSVVRTTAQAAGLAYQPEIFGADFGVGRPLPSGDSFQVQSIPIGYEGVLTLRGGSVHSFTDGDLRLNQSRLFSQQSGDLVLWSSNGDLNAGQGPKSAANVPPIVLRFNPDAGSEVDSAGAVVGAGIAGFAGVRRFNAATDSFELVSVLDDIDVATAEAQLQLLPDRAATVVVNGKTYARDLPAIYLLAPAGTVDAGDAGVRAAGDIFVAAAQVANADNFKVGGTAVGIPALAGPSAPALPASAASALVANVFQTNPTSNVEQRARIFVDVLGYFNAGSDCLDDDGNPKPADQCK